MNGVSWPRAMLLTIVVAAFVAQFACASSSWSWAVDGPNTVEVFRRPVYPTPLLIGKAAPDYRYASKLPPIELIAAEGARLPLRELRVEGLIDDPVSHTELHLVFEAPHRALADAQLELLLARGAKVSRFAILEGERWVEAELVDDVPNDLGLRAALGTHGRERGRRFRAQLDTIDAGERVEIIVETTTVHGLVESIYRVPLAGLPRLELLEVSVTRRRPEGAPEQIEHRREREVPSEDLELELEGSANAGVSADQQALLRVVPLPGPTKASEEATKLAGESTLAEVESISLLVDTSASMAGLAEVSDEALSSLLDGFDAAGFGQTQVEILAFDQELLSLYSGPLSGAKEPSLELLRGRARLGATDLCAALDAVSPDSQRLILISDGDISSGVGGPVGLAAALERGVARGLMRVDALVLDGEADLERLERLVHDEKLVSGVIVDSSARAPAAWVEQLLSPVSPDLSIAVEGASEVWPAHFEGLRRGQAVLVHATFDGQAPATAKVEIEFEFEGGVNQSVFVPLRASDPLLVAHSGAALGLETGAGEFSSGLLDDSTAWVLPGSARVYGVLSDTERDREARRVEVSEVARVSRDAPEPAASMRNAPAWAPNVPIGAPAKRASDWKLTTTASKTAGQLRGGWLFRRVREQIVWAESWVLDCAGHVVAKAHRSPDAFFPGHIELDLALRYDDDARLVEVRSPQPTNWYLEEYLLCLNYVADDRGGATIDQRPSGTPSALDVSLHFTVDLEVGPGDPPADWYMPEVTNFATVETFGSDDGREGWAKAIFEEQGVFLTKEALELAWTWHAASPEDPLAYVSLGQTLLLGASHPESAARAYGSLIDLEPKRAETLRFAGALLETLGSEANLAQAVDAYRKALVLRPDQPISHHSLALGLARSGQLREAIDVLVDGINQIYASEDDAAAVELMRADLASFAAAAIYADHGSRLAITTSMVGTGVVPRARAREWLLMSWEGEGSKLGLEMFEFGDALANRGWTSSRDPLEGRGPLGFERAAGGSGSAYAWLTAHEIGPSGVAMGSVRYVDFDGRRELHLETQFFLVTSEGYTSLGTMGLW